MLNITSNSEKLYVEIRCNDWDKPNTVLCDTCLLIHAVYSQMATRDEREAKAFMNIIGEFVQDERFQEVSPGIETVYEVDSPEELLGTPGEEAAR